MNEFSERIEGLLSGMEWPQKRLAKAIGCSPQYICDIINGRRAPSLKLVESICRYLGCGPAARRAWHLAAARSHGWEI